MGCCGEEMHCPLVENKLKTKQKKSKIFTINSVGGRLISVSCNRTIFFLTKCIKGLSVLVPGQCEARSEKGLI